MLRSVAVMVFVAVSSIAAAQTGGPAILYSDRLKRADVERLTDALRDSIDRLTCDAGQRCAPDTPEERARPLVPYEVELRALDTGFISGTAESCGINATAHFLAMMGYERGSGRWNSRQIAYIGALHGVGQGTILRNADKSTSCDDKARTAVASLLQDRIRQYRGASKVATSPVPTQNSSVSGQNSGPPISSMIRLFSIEQVDRLIAKVRDNIHRLALSDGSTVPRESAAERAQPLLPFDVERRVVDSGMVSGVSEWCGIDSHLHYTAMMAWERGIGQWSDKQLAYIGGLHGAAKSAIMGSRESHICDPNGKAGIANGLMTRVQQYRAATPPR